VRVLALNCGSSSLKFRLSVTPRESSGEERLAWGAVEGVGGRATVDFDSAGGEVLKVFTVVPDHRAAVRRVLGWLGDIAPGETDGLGAVGHRVVDGGERFSAPTLLDDGVVSAIEELGELAPLHNQPALAAIRAAREVLGDRLPMVAVFDTAFHRGIPERAYRYAIPAELADKHGIRRHGFHGLAHRFMTERYAEISSTPLERARIVTLHLGNGCSAAAIEGGRSVDTSMGLTPLEGLMMGTRSGDVDPTLPGYLAAREGVGVSEVVGWLNRRSGLLGVSSISHDMRALLGARHRGDARAALAVEMFCYRIKRQLGAYLAALGGADAVVFGGGIGERSPEVRAAVCAGMGWCGLALDGERNAGAVGKEAEIGAEGSLIRAYAIPVDEEAIIARDAVLCVRGERALRG
jgi:acetate kinase